MNIAIVTGASSGIGEQYVRALQQEHGEFGSVPFEEIWVIARNKEKLAAMKAELNEERIRIFALDLTKPSSITQLSSALKETKPTVGLLINCAGMGKNGPFEDQKLSDIHSTIALNCVALSELTHICLPYMIPLGKRCTWGSGPRIINIASSAGFLPQPDFALYSATKAFVISLSRALEREFKPYNIGVTTVCPGPVDTAFVKTSKGDPNASFTGFKSHFVVSPVALTRKTIQASKKGRGLYVFGFGQKCLHLSSKVLPTAFILFLESKMNKKPSVKAEPQAVVFASNTGKDAPVTTPALATTVATQSAPSVAAASSTATAAPSPAVVPTPATVTTDATSVEKPTTVAASTANAEVKSQDHSTADTTSTQKSAKKPAAKKTTSTKKQPVEIILLEPKTKTKSAPAKKTSSSKPASKSVKAANSTKSTSTSVNPQSKPAKTSVKNAPSNAVKKAKSK